MKKTLSISKAMDHIQEGMTVMIGGFLDVGAPLKMIEALVETGIGGLTVVAVGAGYPGGNFGLGRLPDKRQIKKFITTHIGTVPEYVAQYNSREMEIEFNPMGTWIERIRAGGAGLGGVLTPTGLCTDVEKGRQKIEVNGKTYLLFPPLRADVAIIKGYKADPLGNIQYRGIAINTNPVMATAADYVIAEVDEVVEVGDIEPYKIGTPGILVDAIIQGHSLSTRKEIFSDLWVATKRLD